MNFPLSPIAVAGFAALLCLCGAAIGAQRAPAPERASAPERRAMLAIDAKRASLGLPLTGVAPKPRDCSITQQCPGGGQVSCSASGDFTDCGVLKDKHGNVGGVACSRFTNTAAKGGEQATVNQSKC